MKFNFWLFAKHPIRLRLSLWCSVLSLVTLFEVRASNFGDVHERVVETSCKMIYGRMNSRYEKVVSLDKPMIFTFRVERKYLLQSHTTNLRVEVGTARNTSVDYPILFSVQQQKYINTLEVPRVFHINDMTLDSSSSSRDGLQNPFYNAGRTLCLYDSDQKNRDGRNVTVRVTTQSRTPVPFYLVLYLTSDFQLPLGKEISFNVSPTNPKFFGFAFSRPDMSQVKIRASSNSTTCMTISIQSEHCPIYDSVYNIKYKGLWQTMSTTAAMTVEKMGWYAKGFVLVFVVHADPRVCGRVEDILESPSLNSSAWYPFGFGGSEMYAANSLDPRSKTVTLIITNESSVSKGIILLCLFIPIMTTIIIAVGVLLLFRNRHEWIAKILQDNFGNDVKSYDCSENMLPIPPPPEDEEDGGGSCSIKWKADLTIANFRCKTFEEVEKFSKRFYWTIAIVAIFYSIPVFQLVVHYLRVLYRTGEYDICYYNYLCAHRIGLLIDFNHFWSNASYVIFGMFFIAIVRQRSLNMCPPQRWNNTSIDGGRIKPQGGVRGCTCCPTKRGERSRPAICLCGCKFTKTCFRWDHGVPGHFGVFYALGVALTMEGFLSAAYHLCPNQSTFQFDTCFMYVIAVLLLLKIYQFRHPVHFGANQTFAILAGFVLASVIGLLFERGTKMAVLIYKIIFLIIQYSIMLILCIYYYAVGYIKNENGEKITDISLFLYLGQLKFRRINGDRLILPLISFSICLAVLVYSELGDIGFASYLLYILVGNVLGTTLYYVGIMKPLHGEFKDRTWVQPALYFLAAGLIGGFSMVYFTRAPAQWELSASASRTMNEDCLKEWFPFHPFYDSHDAWHFLSAAALFLAFMVSKFQILSASPSHLQV